MNLDEAMHRLRATATNDKIPFQSFVDTAARVIEEVQFASADLIVGTTFFRARINQAGQRFAHRREIAHVANPGHIRQYGRVNQPGCAMFYCSNDLMTAFMETVDSTLRTDADLEGAATIGTWRVEVSIPSVAVALDADEWTRVFSDSDTLGHVIRDELKRGGRVFTEDAHRAMNFLNALFRARVTNSAEYRVSCAVFEALARKKRVNGISYPSVMSEALGVNTALLPDVVDKHLKLVDVCMVDFRKRSREVEMRIKDSSYFGSDGRFEFR